VIGVVTKDEEKEAANSRASTGSRGNLKHTLRYKNVGGIGNFQKGRNPVARLSWLGVLKVAGGSTPVRERSQARETHGGTGRLNAPPQNNAEKQKKTSQRWFRPRGFGKKKKGEEKKKGR